MVQFNNLDMKKWEKPLEFFFGICLFVVVALGHQQELVQVSRVYRIFFALMVCTGIELNNIKNNSLKESIIYLIYEFSIPFIGALIVAKINGNVDMSNIFPVLYITPLIILSLLIRIKREWRIDGKLVKLTEDEFLKVKIGKYSIISTKSLYIIAVLFAFKDLSFLGYACGMIIIWFIFNIIYIVLVEKLIEKNLLNK